MTNLQTLDADMHAPRVPEQRYGLYAAGEELALLATGSSLAAIGTAIGTLSEEGDLEPTERIGIRDRIERRWIVEPDWTTVRILD